MKIRLTLWSLCVTLGIMGCAGSRPYNLPPAERLFAPGPGVAGPGPGVLTPTPPPGMAGLPIDGAPLLWPMAAGSRLAPFKSCSIAPRRCTSGGMWVASAVLIPNRSCFLAARISRKGASIG